MKTTFLLIGFSLLLVSCQPSGQNETETNITEELTISLESITSTYDSIQYGPLYSLSADVYDQYEWFKQNYKDTTNRSFWITELSDLQIVERSIRKARGDSTSIADELILSRSQLVSLKDSYLNGSLDSLSFHTYLFDEENAMQELNRKIRLRHLETNEGLEKWAKLKPILDSTRNYISNQ